MRRILTLVLSIGIIPVLLHGDDAGKESYETLLLWPDDPELNTLEGMGKVEVTNKTRVSEVKTPHLRIYQAPKREQPTAAIILVPGGGYSRLVPSTHDATVDWLGERGIRPFMLMYRCPTTVKDDGVLSDIQRAIRVVRSKAEEWNIDPKRIGVLGSSAGGNLCVRASCDFNKAAYPARDATDKVSARPDFTILLYPAYLGKSKLSERYKIPDDVPPTMIIAARNDGMFSNSPTYEKALKEAGAKVRSHYLDKGGHGFTLNEDWSGAFREWLEETGAFRE